MSARLDHSQVRSIVVKATSPDRGSEPSTSAKSRSTRLYSSKDTVRRRIFQYPGFVITMRKFVMLFIHCEHELDVSSTLNVRAV